MRNDITTRYGREIGSHVGCALDRLNRPVTENETQSAIQYWLKHREELKRMAIGDKRQQIADFVASLSKH